MKITKTEHMDQCLTEQQKPITIHGIFKIVESVYGIALGHLPGLVPEPAQLLTNWLSGQNDMQQLLDSNELREKINQLYGVNLQALSQLEDARISLFSKERWMLRHEQDLFELYTGEGDSDVKIITTAYYKKITGSNNMPPALIDNLLELGYSLHEPSKDCSSFTNSGSSNTQSYCYYINPEQKPVADSFKGRTMRLIADAIRQLDTKLQI